LGYVEHGKLPEYYLDADIFVLPSLAEGMPNVVLEAMGSGLPIVATRVPGSEELVHEGENGFLLESGNTDKLAQNLATLINDRALREEMGHTSKGIAREYGWDLVAERYVELYERAVSQRAHLNIGEFETNV
jgi:glycosyltransferase involved in cell wall biosynthesis